MGQIIPAAVNKLPAPARRERSRHAIRDRQPEHRGIGRRDHAQPARAAQRLERAVRQGAEPGDPRGLRRSIGAQRADHGRRPRVLLRRRHQGDARRRRPTAPAATSATCSRSATTRSSPASGRCPSRWSRRSTAPPLGIGCSLALACDLIWAAESAIFGLAFVNIGLVPDGGSTFLVPVAAGKARALEMALLGEPVSAETANEWGLINRVVPDDKLMEEARGLARRLARGPTRSYAQSKRALNQSLMRHMGEQLDLEADIQREMTGSADFIEGITAFVEKRDPRVQGRLRRHREAIRASSRPYTIPRPMRPRSDSRRGARVVPLLVAAFALVMCGLLTAGPAWGDAFSPESGPTRNAQDIDTLYWILFGLGMAVIGLVWGVLFYSLVKFRARRGVTPPQIRGNTHPRARVDAGRLRADARDRGGHADLPAGHQEPGSLRHGLSGTGERPASDHQPARAEGPGRPDPGLGPAVPVALPVPERRRLLREHGRAEGRDGDPHAQGERRRAQLVDPEARAASSTPSRGSPTRPGSRRRRRAASTASARSSAVPGTRP